MVDKEASLSIHELLKLTDVGVTSKDITWTRVRMSSDAHVSVRYTGDVSVPPAPAPLSTPSTSTNTLAPPNGSLARRIRRSSRDDTLNTSVDLPNEDRLSSFMILDLYSTNDCKSIHNIKVDCAQISPQNYRLAIKVGNTFRISGLEIDAPCLYHCRLDDVIYWCWLNSDTLALITNHYVFHWKLSEGLNTPNKIFTREKRLDCNEITAYKCDVDFNWFALCSLQPVSDNILGFVQLYSNQQDCTQCISAHSVTFTNYCFMGNKYPSTVLCMAGREAKSTLSGKLDIVELEPHIKENFALTNRFDTFKLSADSADFYDFPLTMLCSTHLAVVYMITKYGDAYVFDVETATAIVSCCRVSTSIVFTMALNTRTQGVIFVNRAGQIVSVDVNLKSANGQYSKKNATLVTRLRTLLYR